MVSTKVQKQVAAVVLLIVIMIAGTNRCSSSYCSNSCNDKTATITIRIAAISIAII